MRSRVHLSGFVIAGIGFFLTRFTVTLAIYDDPLRFYFAGVIPLLLGLGLAAFGVALAVADVDPALVRTTASWCVVGLVTMVGLVMLTLLGSSRGTVPDVTTMRSQAYLSNFLIGGSVGGTLTGLYAARNRRHRWEIQRQANRFQVLNRLLRHEVLNAVAVIQGWSSLEELSAVARGREAIEHKAHSIEATVEEVSALTRGSTRTDPPTTAVDLRTCLETSIATVRDTYPDATFALEGCPERLPVRATDRICEVFVHLLENAVGHTDDGAPVVEVTTTPATARITVRDNGPGLPASQRALLEDGVIQPYDDPETGFGLNLSRLIVEDANGSIDTEVGPDGSEITVELPLAEADTDPFHPGAAGVRPALPHLLVTLGAAVLAGVGYGLASELLGGSVAGIGVFYGAANPVVGWLTHEFHSIVFGFVFAGVISLAPARYRESVVGHVGIGLGWALTLWLVAAGVIAPIWLQLLGIPAAIPHLSGTLLVSHLVWGLMLGVGTAVGYGRVVPWLDNRIELRGHGSG